jgi:PQQ-dependent catabolism-associated CXXCW motif protein
LSLAVGLLAALLGCAPEPAEPWRPPSFVADPIQWVAVLIGAGREERAFDNATALMRKALLQAGVPERDIRVLSARGQGGSQLPLRENIEAAFSTLVRNPSVGCFVYITGHGDERGLRIEVAQPFNLAPAELASLLDKYCGARATIAIMSGCHTGTYLGSRSNMRKPTRVLMAAARTDRTSFGCNAGAELTVYDRCLLQNLAVGQKWAALQARVEACVARWEDRFHYEPPSLPQFAGGGAVETTAVKLSNPGIVDADRNALRATRDRQIAALKAATPAVGPFAREIEDRGIAPQSRPETRRVHGPTPLTVPGATTLTTRELQERLARDPAFRVIDVLGALAETRQVIPGALWVPNFGGSDWTGAPGEHPRRAAAFRAILAKAAPKLDDPVAFYCLNADCWLSYNAALHALRLGYRRVYWYRGGSEAWSAARLPFAPALPEETPP